MVNSNLKYSYIQSVSKKIAAFKNDLFFSVLYKLLQMQLCDLKWLLAIFCRLSEYF